MDCSFLLSSSFSCSFAHRIHQSGPFYSIFLRQSIRVHLRIANNTNSEGRLPLQLASVAQSNSRFSKYRLRKLPKNLRHPRRPKQPPDPFYPTAPPAQFSNITAESYHYHESPYDSVSSEHNDGNEIVEEEGCIQWDSEEIEAISSLFKCRTPQRARNFRSSRERPLPLPLPHKLRPLGVPPPKMNIKKPSSAQAVMKQVYKNPTFLIGLAKQIRGLSQDEDVSKVLNNVAHLLRKGSLSLTIRELGHMGLPERALHVFCWVQKQNHLFPDDHILASTVEVLARFHDLKMELNFLDDKFISLASKRVYEAMVRGFIKGGSLKLARRLLLAAKKGNRMLDTGIYAKLILELAKNPDRSLLVLELLEDLAEREDLNLTQQDCTGLMKVCIRLKKFGIVEGLYDWFRKSGSEPSVVMYTTIIHSRYLEKKYREALAVVWEMEASNCLFDLPAYRIAIKLFVALNDLPRSVRYFSKLKEAGFAPTFDIYKIVIKTYAASGRMAKCKTVCKEAELAGFELDDQTRKLLSQLEN